MNPLPFIPWGGPVAKPLVAIILAAGEGTRMKSKVPKVLHPVGGKALIDYALEHAQSAGASRIFLVVGAHAEAVQSYVGKRAVPVVQKKRLGTGHAVQQVLPKLKGFTGDVLVIYGDSALLRPQTLMGLRQFHQFHGGAATLLTATVKDPFGYGRIVRDRDGKLEKIIEENDADEETRRIHEVNGGTYLFQAGALETALKKIKPKNAKGEYYLTDCVGELIWHEGKVEALTVPDSSEILGINDRAQWSEAHRLLNLRRVEDHQRQGVTFLNPATVEIGAEVMIGQDSIIEGGVTLEGAVVLNEGCRIESGSRVVNAQLGKQVTVRSSRVFDSRVGDGSDVGPNAYVRGGCEIGPGVHIGTNAELKNVQVKTGSKIGHFSYVGDAVLGKDVNVGAGCVFANFDGKKKHQTQIGDHVFLGSNSTLVAPLKIGPRAVIGAGSVVTRDVAPGSKVVGVPARPVKKK
jgi:bifunctional UDP-N-acetylglucosamine pyrophosphorylase/glucosamine-1-phosphate N-acetyltransferase